MVGEDTAYIGRNTKTPPKMQHNIRNQHPNLIFPENAVFMQLYSTKEVQVQTVLCPNFGKI
jgi:hypothetical protein